jgi:CheY-like chemotaxis protein
MATASPDHGGRAAAWGSHVAKLLIAEDEAAVRDVSIRGFEAAGHEVTAVADGTAALQALEDDAYDLLLTDIVMPELDGVSLALKVTKEWPGLPIVLMTGFADQQARARNLSALVHDVIAKPFELADILSVVDAALKRRT